jgi:hypothetical protein
MVTNAATGFVKAGSSIFSLSNVSYTDKPFSLKKTAPPLRVAGILFIIMLASL